MDIIVPHRIKRKELSGTISDEARKLFAKLRDGPEIAVGISARGLPASTTLHKVYATTEGGPRRLLFLCWRATTPADGRPFYSNDRPRTLRDFATIMLVHEATFKLTSGLCRIADRRRWERDPAMRIIPARHNA